MLSELQSSQSALEAQLAQHQHQLVCFRLICELLFGSFSFVSTIWTEGEWGKDETTRNRDQHEEGSAQQSRSHWSPNAGGGNITDFRVGTFTLIIVSYSFTFIAFLFLYQLEALDTEKQSAALDDLSQQINQIDHERKKIEADMTSLSEGMRRLHLQADSRAKLNAKKSQREDSEAAYLLQYTRPLDDPSKPPMKNSHRCLHKDMRR